MLLYQEKQRRAANRIKRFLGINNLWGLDKVSLVKNDSIIKLIEKRDIKSAYHWGNKAKFSQIISTLATESSLMEDLVFLK